MAEVLSQQEIDNLLNNMDEGGIEEKSLLEPKEEKEIYDYDFRRPNRVSKDQIRTLRTIHESFSETFGFYLASKLQTMVSIELMSIDQLRYSEFILSISNPSCLYIFDIEGGDGKGVLELSPLLVLLIVERMLGGEGEPKEEPRIITYIEQRIMQPLLKRAMTYLSNAWKPIHNLTFHQKSFESNPDFVQVAPASEIVLILSFEIKIGDVTHLMNICYPTFALEDVIQKLSAQLFSVLMANQNKEDYQHKVRDHLKDTMLDFIWEFGQTNLSVRDLLHLQVKDVITLNTKITDLLEVKIKERPKFKVRPGTVDGKLSIKIEEIIDEDCIKGKDQA